MFRRFYGGARQWITLARLDHEAKERAMQETGWADVSSHSTAPLRDPADLSQGLRGIAALYVVSSHVVLCYAVGLVNPCCDNGRPSLFQRPILRLVTSGHSWVAIFFILMGFVNSLKPVALARSGKADAASAKLATSAFSRVLRLVLPAAFATCLSWLLCQLGFYEMSRQSDAFWLEANTPEPSLNIFAAFVDLKSALVNTWLLATDNVYDQPQWALIYLLQGSLMTILALLMTINMTPLWRTLSLGILAFVSLDWSHRIGDRKWDFVLSLPSADLELCSLGRSDLFLRHYPCRVFDIGSCYHARPIVAILESAYRHLCLGADVLPEWCSVSSTLVSLHGAVRQRTFGSTRPGAHVW